MNLATLLAQLPMSIEGGRFKLPPFPVRRPMPTKEILPVSDTQPKLEGLPISEPIPQRLGYIPAPLVDTQESIPINTELQELLSKPKAMSVAPTAKGGEIPSQEAIKQAGGKDFGGYFDPNTGEIYVKSDMPKWAKDTTKFHEQTHKLFSENPQLLKQIKSELKLKNEEKVIEIMERSNHLGGSTGSMIADKIIYEPETLSKLSPKEGIENNISKLKTRKED